MLTQMDCFGLTDSGRKRPTNQDHYLIADLNKSMRVHDTSLTPAIVDVICLEIVSLTR